MFIAIITFCCFYFQIDAAKPIAEVFDAVKVIFTAKDEKVKHHACVIL